MCFGPPPSAHGSHQLSVHFGRYFPVLVFFIFALLIRTFVHSHPPCSQGYYSQLPQSLTWYLLWGWTGNTDMADSAG